MSFLWQTKHAAIAWQCQRVIITIRRIRYGPFQPKYLESNSRHKQLQQKEISNVIQQSKHTWKHLNKICEISKESGRDSSHNFKFLSMRISNSTLDTLTIYFLCPCLYAFIVNSFLLFTRKCIIYFTNKTDITYLQYYSIRYKYINQCLQEIIQISQVSIHLVDHKYATK